MRYKEFKEKIEDWGEKYGYETKVIISDFQTYVKVETNEEPYVAAQINNIYMFALETRWNYSAKINNHARGELFDILIEFAKTPLEDRRDEKRFIIPLPELITTDGEQQYLTYKYFFFFASSRDEDLRQIWTEDELKFVPDVYRQFAVEFNEGKEH